MTALAYATVVGKLTHPASGAPLTGQVTLTCNATGSTPSRLLLTTETPPRTIAVDPVVAILDGTGSFSVQVVGTDQAGVTNPSGFTYTASFQIPGVQFASFAFAAPANTTVDLTTVTPAAVATGVQTILLSQVPDLGTLYVRGSTPADMQPAYFGANSFDRKCSLYNGGASKFRNLRAALAGALLGTQLCEIGVVADSIASGFGSTWATSWPQLLKAMLVKAGYPDGGSGWLPMWAGPSPSPSAWTIPGSSWLPYAGLFGSHETSMMYAAAVSTDQPSVASSGTIVELLCANALRAKVDGGAFGAVGGPANTPTVNMLATGLTDASHTITIATDGVTVPEVWAGRVRRTGGVQVSNWAVAGMQSSDVALNNSWDQAYAVARTNPAALLIDIGTNDKQLSIPVATYKANILAAVSNLLNGATTTDLILMASPPQNNGFSDTAFRIARYQLADQLGLPLIDLTDVFGTSWAAANSLGLFADVVHPNAKGAMAIAWAIFNALTV